LHALRKIGPQYAILVFLQMAAMLVAIQLRIQILPFGHALGPEYRAFPGLAIGVILGSSLPPILLGRLLLKSTSRSASRLGENLFPKLLGASILAAAGLYLLQPTFSQLQILYFVLSTIFIGGLFISLPKAFLKGKGNLDLIQGLRQLWEYRHLLSLWLRYTIQARYTQTTLGIIWIVLLPLSTALVLSLAFSQFLRIGRFAGNVPFLTFFLAGIVPYGVFNSGASKSTSAVSGQIGIISRVYFPREILILLPIGEAIIDFVFTFLVLVVINGIYGNWPQLSYILLIVPLLILVLLSLGIMFVIGTWSMLVRDIPQLVGVALQLLFYVTPIIYPFESIPPSFRFLILLNPLTPLIQAFRQIVIYNQGLDLVSLYYPLVVSLGMLFAGYAFFKSREGVLSDLV
jgi:lipopolysaccharide transport system permease protein